MQAVVQINNPARPCVVYSTARVRLHVEIVTWCGEKVDASDGVLQVPDDAHVCTKCEGFIKTGIPNL